MLIVRREVDQLVSQQKSYDQPLNQWKINNTVDVWSKRKNFLSFFSFFSASYNRIIIVCNKNILTIAIVNLSSSEKHCKEHSNKLKIIS